MVYARVCVVARPQVSRRGLAVARGEEPADLLITGGRVFADATREFVDTSLAIADGMIVGWGERDSRETVDVGGAALTPGFVDAHMHLESTKLWIDEFVSTVLPLGTTAVAADPHELANVLGVPGVLALIEAAAPLPFTFAVYAPSCVPASSFEVRGRNPRGERHPRPDPRPRRARGRRGHELPGRDRRRRGDAGADRRGRRIARRRSQPGRVRAGARRLHRRRRRVRSRGDGGSRRRRRNAGRACGCSCARDRPARTSSIWRRRSLPMAPTQRPSAPMTASPTRC